MQRERIKYLLEKHAANVLTENERKELEVWYQSFDTKEDEHIIQFEQHSANKRQKIYKNILEAIDTEDSGKISRSVLPLRWAATIALLLVTSMLLLNYRAALYQQLLSATRRTVVVPEGKMQILTLPDDSKIWLRSGTTLTYNRFFIGKERKLVLNGEAYFEVEENPDKPFVVQSGPLKTTVLGTSFNVKALSGLDIYEVIVRTGKVLVSDSLQVLATLFPSGRISLKNDRQLLDSTNVEAYLQWREGDLVFDSSSMEEIRWYLENRFDVRIELVDEVIKKHSFSGDFTGFRLDQILKMMQEIHPFEIVYQNEKQLIIRSPRRIKNELTQ